jgi:hypothetical protein
VGADPDLAAAYVEVFCESGPVQMAAVVAAAYNAEFSDETLRRRMRQAAAHNTVTAAALAGVGYRPSPHDHPVVLKFDLNQLASGDTGEVGRVFAAARLTPEQARAARGRVVLALPLEDEPRPPATIPEVRRLVRNIAAAVPHFAYFLAPGPEQGMTYLWFGSLAPLEGHWPEGLVLSAPVVLEAIRPSLEAVRDYCGRTGEDPGDVLADVLAFCPEGFRARLLTALLGGHRP